MKKKRRLYKAIRKAPFMLALGAAGFAFHSAQRVEAEPQPDPQEVVAYLDQLEQTNAAARAKDHRDAAAKKRIRNIVESAAVRAPSDAMLNRIENTVVAPRG